MLPPFPSRVTNVRREQAPALQFAAYFTGRNAETLPPGNKCDKPTLKPPHTEMFIAAVHFLGSRLSIPVRFSGTYPKSLLYDCPFLWVQFTVYFKLHTPHSTLNSPHSTLHTQLSTLHTPHSTLHTRHSTLNSPHSTLHTRHSTLDHIHFTL